MIKTNDLFKRSGVALADILANSVAVILILLIATLDVEQKKSEDELQENANITTILSRQISTNVVFNDLPTSPPAVLHDYNSCAIAHDCDPARYPIIEVYDDYARIISRSTTNQKFYPSELLKQKNALERYISSLSTEDRANIRFDIHGVGQYYLVLSILSELNIRPRHWHYLGENAPKIAFNQLANEQSFGEQESNSNATKNKIDNPTDEANNAQTQESGTQNQTDILEGQIGKMTLNTQQYDSLLPEDNNVDAANLDPNLLAQLQQSTGISQAQLLELIKFGTNSRGSNNASYQSKMYIPNLKTQLKSAPTNGAQPLELAKHRIFILANLLNILNYATLEQTFDLSLQAKSALKIATLTDISKHPHYEIIKQLDQQLNKKQALNNKLNQIKYPQKLTSNQLIITANKAVPKIDIALIENENWLQKQASLKIDYLLRLYPTLFKGEFLKSTDNMTILVRPEEFNNPNPRWLPIAAFDYRLENISLGFIYAAMDNNRLVIDTNINQVKLNNRYLSKIKINQNKHSDYSNSSIMWLLLLVFIILLLAKPWIKQSIKS